MSYFFLFTSIFALISSLEAEQPSVKQVNTSFEQFTGKVLGNRVRMRAQPDLEAAIIKELKKHDLLLVVGEESGFWKVSPPATMKAYVFRSYILDDVVEADRVNIRLEPSIDSYAIGQMQSGEKISGNACQDHPKWLEIAMPKNTFFYVAKEYLSFAGDASYLSQMNTKKEEVEKLLNSAFFITEKECKKPYDAMQPQDAIAQFEAIIQSYSDFPEHVQQAKEGLSLIQDNYLQKKLAFLEQKKELTAEEKEELFAGMQKIEKKKTKPPEVAKTNFPLFDTSCYWQQQEKKLYNQWKSYNPEKDAKQYYLEQSVNAQKKSGYLQLFSASINNKPGDYVLIDPITKKRTAFLYSTKVNLTDYLGKEVRVKISPRPNHQFAYPAFFVHSVEAE